MRHIGELLSEDDYKLIYIVDNGIVDGVTCRNVYECEEEMILTVLSVQYS